MRSNTTLGQVCILKAGKFVAANDVADTFIEGLYPCYGGNGVRGYVADFSHEGQFPLIGRQGALCGNVNFATGKFRATEHAVVVQPKDELVDVRWLYYKLIAMDLRQYATGAAQPGLAVATLEKLPISIPEIDLQRAVAQTFDRVEQLISLRKQQLQKLDELVKARFIELFGDPVADSMKWGQLPLSHYLKSIRYGTSTPPSFSEAGYEFIRATNIKNGKIVNSDMKYISEEEAQMIEKCKVLGGEMIVVRSGVNAGDTCIITDEHCGQYAGYDMILVFTEELHPVFVNVLLNTEYMDRVVKPLTRRAAQPHLNSEQVQSLPIIQVPYDQQNQFAAFVKQTDKSKVAIQQSLDKLELLKKALMQKYFG